MTSTTGVVGQYLDGCPRCLQRHNPPTHAEPAGSGVRATYRCAGCRHCWATWWAAANNEMAAARQEGR